MNRRSFLGALALAGPAVFVISKAAPASAKPVKVRVLSPLEVGIEVTAYADTDGAVIFEFRHVVRDQFYPDGGPPVEVGESLYFDGRPWGSPVIEGRVTRVATYADNPGMEYVTLRRETAGLARGEEKHPSVVRPLGYRP